jgi:hypothetical protein
MFRKLSQAAEQVASRVSRRSFLGSLGGWSLGAAALLAGILSATETSAAQHGALRKKCCAYGGWGACGRVCIDASLQCPRGSGVCGLVAEFPVKSCRQCR